MLTVDEYADRLKVSRTTVFSWLKSGELREGVDYIRRGRILRLRWQDGLFFISKAVPETFDEVALLPTLPETLTIRRKNTRGKKGTTPVINLDYQ